MDEQQVQTKEYFSKVAKEWADKAVGKAAKVNVIKQRNGCVLDALDRHGNITSFLDVGCGTGDLVHSVAQKGVLATGVDFSETMIEQAETLCRDMAGNKPRFLAGNIFDFEFENGQFDAISANGFIEYISPVELETFLSRCHGYLKPSGMLILSARNRLFNCFSLNDYTELEISQHPEDFQALIREAVTLCKCDSVQELKKLAGDPTAVSMQRFAHPKTNIDVSVRYQFTPLQLTGILEEHGFGVTNLQAIHSHPAPPGFQRRFKDVHIRVADLLYEVARDALPLIPFASTFMIMGVKH